MKSKCHVVITIVVIIGFLASAFILVLNEDALRSYSVFVAACVVGACRFSQSFALIAGVTTLGIMLRRREGDVARIANDVPLIGIASVALCFGLKASITYWFICH